MSITLLQHFCELILFLVFLISPIPLGLCLISISQRENSQVNAAHNLLTILIYWCCIQVFVCLSLGLIGQFFLAPVVAFEILIFLLGICLLISTERHLTLTLIGDLFKFRKRLTKPEIFIVASIILAFCILTIKLATEVVINYDSLSYHLPTMARWYQEGKFVRLEEFSATKDWSTNAITYYPFNWEILCTLFVMPFREDFLVTFPNLFALSILGLSIYLLSIKSGASRFYSIASVSLVLTIPLIIQHVNSLHIDLPFAAFFLASLYFAIAYSQSRSSIDISSFCATVCMLLGIKLSAVGYAVLPIFVFIYLEIRNIFLNKNISDHISTNQYKTAFPKILISILVSLFLGLYWYIKNFIEVGNPLGDIQISIAGIQLFHGSMEMSTLRQNSLASLFHFTDFSHWKILLTQVIVRLQLPFLALVLQLALLPRLIFLKQKFTLVYILCCCVLFGTGYLYWSTPFTGTNLLPPLPPQPINQYIGQQIRFAMPFMGLIGVIAATNASIIRTSKYVVVLVVFISSLLGIISSTIFDVIRISTAFKGGVGWASSILNDFTSNPAVALEKTLAITGSSLLNVMIYIFIYIIIFLILVWTTSRQRIMIKVKRNLHLILSKKSRRFIFVCILIGLFIITSWVVRIGKDISRKEVYGGTYEYLASNLKSNENLGYSLSYRSYLFYGKNWSQKVLYVPSKSEFISDWLTDLHQKQINIFAVGPLEESMGWQPREIVWLEKYDEQFTTVFGQKPIVVFGQDPKQGVKIYKLQSK